MTARRRKRAKPKNLLEMLTQVFGVEERDVPPALKRRMDRDFERWEKQWQAHARKARAGGRG